MLGLGPDRKILRDRVQCRLCIAGAHAARPRYSCGLWPAQERDREALGARAHGIACDGDDRLGLDLSTSQRREAVFLFEFSISCVKFRSARGYFEIDLQRTNFYCRQWASD